MVDQPIAFAPPEITDDDVAAVTAVLRSGWITTGPECDALEAELGAFLGGARVVALASCTAALEAAIAGLHLPPGARVGVPTWTYVATALAVVHQGGQPVLVDVDPQTLNVSPDALAAATAQGLDAVVVVHFGGVPVAASIFDLCARHGVPVVEDAAHAFGASDHRGVLNGRGSVAACFSFYATKNMTSAEGGALVTHDPEVERFTRAFRLHGLSAGPGGRNGPTSADLVAPGIKGNLPDVLAALARSQLARFRATQDRRLDLVRQYRRRLAEIDGVAVVPAVRPEGSSDHLMVVVLPARCDRQQVAADLRAAGIETSVHFRPLHNYPWMARHAAVGPGGLPVADGMAGRVLSLPLHPQLTGSLVDRICDALAYATR
ncbi:MAG TPA: DegT/DnrJ/EryC1/StrS family aminotransferase [Acidimicrobiales bacterium]|jgi:dTDP-4-amino-4,6-dideoxygalactose transaminase|nr:DegT/DnrJ/EryC1/StrS family aminotransferase [Acidimicrobiales bacterium]